MSVKIRLKRMGKPNKPFYRIVAIHKDDTKCGRVIEVLGEYNPVPKPPLIKLKKEQILAWMKKGATPSKTIEKLMKRA